MQCVVTADGKACRFLHGEHNSMLCDVNISENGAKGDFRKCSRATRPP